jgi:hypothetical protein
MLFAGCLIVGYLIAPWCGQWAVHRFLNALTAGLDQIPMRPKAIWVISKSLFSLYLVSFILLIRFSDSGLRWITNSREAYAAPRHGEGVLYAIALAALFAAYFFDLFNINLSAAPRRVARDIRNKAICYCIPFYFMGSKMFILNVVIIGIVFYNYHVRPIGLRALLLTGALIVAGIAGLLILQGTASSGRDVVSYADYFQNTATFLRRFNEFGGYQWGAVGFSDLWGFVPRFLYPDKPVEYGSLLLDRALFPGAANVNYTPGFLNWTAAYWDFGPAGVVGSGLFLGLYYRWLHEYYIRSGPNAIRFFLLVQFGYFTIFFHLPPIGVLFLVVPGISLVYFLIARYLVQLRRAVPA